ncbi:hypothetical protein [Rhizobium leguminosarum]|nr:hypothetical protein [Rhizobium leguminosarum]
MGPKSRRGFGQRLARTAVAMTDDIPNLMGFHKCFTNAITGPVQASLAYTIVEQVHEILPPYVGFPQLLEEVKCPLTKLAFEHGGQDEYVGFGGFIAGIRIDLGRSAVKSSVKWTEVS